MAMPPSGATVVEFAPTGNYGIIKVNFYHEEVMLRVGVAPKHKAVELNA